MNQQHTGHFLSVDDDMKDAQNQETQEIIPHFGHNTFCTIIEWKKAKQGWRMMENSRKRRVMIEVKNQIPFRQTEE